VGEEASNTTYEVREAGFQGGEFLSPIHLLCISGRKGGGKKGGLILPKEKKKAKKAPSLRRKGLSRRTAKERRGGNSILAFAGERRIL